MRYLLFTFLVHLSGFISAQTQIQFDHLEIPNTRVRTVFQDRQGFMWFGSDQGLIRYDGYNLRDYVVKPNDSVGHTGGAIDYILEDHLGNLWCFALDQRGLYRFDPTREQFTIYRNNPQDSSSIHTNSVACVYQDSQNRLWVGTRAGLSLYNNETDGFKQIFFKQKFSAKRDSIAASHDSNSSPIWEIFEYSRHEFWLRIRGRLVKFNPETLQLNDWSELETPFFYFHRNSKNEVFANNDYLHKYDTVTDSFVQVHDAIVAIKAADGHDRLYTLLWPKGMAIYNTITQQLRQVLPDFGDPYALRDGLLNRVLVDHSSLLWISHIPMSGTASSINIYNPNRWIYHHVNYLPTNNSHSDLQVWAIHVDQLDNVWIGTKNHGLIKYNPNTKHSLQYFYDPEHLKTNVWGNGIFSIYEDKYGIIWAGSWSNGLYKLDPVTDKWKNYKQEFELQGLALVKNSSIYEDSEGYLWIGHKGANGIAMSRVKFSQGQGFEREFAEYEYFPYQLDADRAISDFRVSEFHEDANSDLWIATENGLNRYNRSGNDFDHYLPREKIHTLFTDSNKSLWIGTSSGLFKGIFQNITDSVKFQRIEITEQLAGKATGILYEDQKGNLWGGADSKLFRYNPKTGECKLFDQRDGVLMNSMIDGSISSNGVAAIGGNNGFVLFRPDSLKENPFIPPVVFTDFQVNNQTVSLHDSLNGQPILSQTIHHTKTITLPYGQSFSFEFSALDYANPEKNLYQYKMEGFDEDWSPPSINRTATYTNLWEGDYTFRVKGSNNDGVWNQEGASIQITITPPLWRSWWAYSLYGITFLGIIMGFFRFFMARERLKGDLKLEHLELEKVKEMDSMKTQFFANVSHEFRTPLTLILGPLKQMHEGTFKGDTRSVMGMMIRNSKRLLRLINQLLDFSKLEAGEMELVASEGDAVEFTRTIFSAFESTAKSRGIRYDFRSNQENLLVYYDRDKLEKIIINLLSNAFKFTEEGLVSLSISDKAAHSQVDRGHGVLEIRITDTGLGISAEKLPHIFDRFFQADPSYTRVQEGTGIGLALTKQLVELHHGNINVSSTPGVGTVFTIHLPLGKDHLSEEELVIRTGYHPVDDTAIESLADELLLTSNGEGENEALPMVLVVDDNTDMRSYINASITEDFRLLEASNGIRGWESAIKHIPDLVISDVMMPRMDGHQLCERLKTDERTCHIPVILLTARAGEKAKLEGLKTGADDYLTKPFSADELKVRVKNLIEIRKKLSERYSKDISLQPKDIAITSLDEQFLEKVMEIVEKHRINTEFGAEDFAREMGMSRSQMHRKLVALTGQTTSDFIRSYRLNYARQLIEKNFGNMTQVAYESGFSSPSYFTVCFKKHFGISPKEYKKEYSSGEL